MQKIIKLTGLIVGMVVFLYVMFLILTPAVVLASEGNNVIYTYNWGQLNTQIYEAQQLTKGSSTVLVGVIDSGISSHLQGAQLQDGDLHRNYMYDKMDGVPTDEPVDSLGHGTMVAGVIAAQYNASTKFVGVAPNIKIVSLNAFNSNGVIVQMLDNDLAIIKAIEYAASTLNNGNSSDDISILNFSGAIWREQYVGSYFDSQMDKLYNAINNYANKGGLLVCSAGNQGINIDGTNNLNISPTYPSKFNLNNIISVGAINEDNTIVDFGDWSNSTKASNFGKTSVDLFAPGTDIYTTNRNGGYEYVSGTSFSAPFVTGVAALLKSIDPTLTGTQIKEIILNNVDELDGFDELCVTGGKLNALKAVNSIAYDYDASTATITGLNFVPNGELIIPSVINGQEILALGANLFADCLGLTKITIPSSVTTIGDYAFENCRNLTEIIINQGTELESIGNYAFSYCTILTTMKLSDDSTATTGVFIPNSVETIGEGAFNFCTSMTGVSLPSGLTTIANNTFFNCSLLVNITIPSTVTTIGNRAFQNCGALTSITIPSNATTVGEYVFSQCEKLASITVLANLSTISNGLFSGCEQLTIITIPSTVTSIGDSAFAHCGKLTHVTIPQGVTTIGQNAFFWCLELEYVSIPQTVVSIGQGAFQGCTNITDITLPSAVTRIESNTFAGCYALETINIPTGLTYIGSNAFQSCTSLGEITIVEGVSEVGRSAFNGWDSDQIIYVDVSEEDRAGWNTYWAFFCNAQIIYRADGENSE